MDQAVVVSVGVFILAAVGSLAGAIAQVRIAKTQAKNDEKKQRMFFYEQHRAEAIEKYLDLAGAVCKYDTPEAFKAFGAVCYQAYLYIPPEHWGLVDAINNKLTLGSTEAPLKELAALCQALATDTIKVRNPVPLYKLSGKD